MQDQSSDDSILANLVEDVSEQLREGNEVPWELIRTKYPHLFDRVIDLLPTLQQLAIPKRMLDHELSGNRNLLSPIELESQLGDFQLIGKIGQGGMGEVYEAVQISLQRTVALKLFRMSNSQHDRYRIRFENEAIAASRLHHPNIVPVYAIGTQGDAMFYAMQRIEGQTFGQFIASRINLGEEVYIREVVRMVGDIAMALDFAHESGVVHRDIKPSNLMRDSRSHVWVLDFGLAAFDKQSNLTVTGETIGTLRYASPEQLLGAEDRIDRRMDVYSLGATLYELLASVAPFANVSKAGLLHAIAHHGPISLSHQDRMVPQALCRIVEKAMERDSRDRYQTCRELAEDLERYSKGVAILARQRSTAIRASRWIQARPFTSIGGLLLLFLFVCGLAVAWSWRRELSLAKDINRMQQSVIDSKEVEWKATSLLGSITKMRDRHDRHETGWLYQNLDELELSCQLATNESERATLRSEAVRTWCGNDMRKVKTLLSGSDVFQCIWNADGTEIVAGMNSSLLRKGELVIFSGDDLSQKRSLSFPSPKQLGLGEQSADGVRSLIFAQEGEHLYCGTRYGLLHRWNRNETVPSKSIRAHAKGIMDIEVSMEHAFIATVSYDRFVRLWNPDTLEMLQEMEWDEPVNRIEIAENDLVVTGKSVHKIKLVDNRMVGPSRKVCEEQGLEFSNATPEGQGVVVSKPESVYVFDRVSGEKVRTFRYENQDINPEYADSNQIDFSENTKLMFTSDRAGVKMWDYSSGRIESRYQMGGKSAIGVATNPRSNRVAIWGDNRLEIFEHYDSPFYQTSPTRLYGVEVADFAASGNFLVDVSLRKLDRHDGLQFLQEVHCYDQLSGRQVHKSSMHDGIRRISFTDDGKSGVAWNIVGGNFLLVDCVSRQDRYLKISRTNVDALVLSNDGKIIYVAHETPRLERTSGSQVKQILTAIRTGDEMDLWQWENSLALQTGTPGSIRQIQKRGTELVLLCLDSFVRVLDAATGKLVYERLIPGHALSSLYVDDPNTTIVGSEKGDLLLLDQGKDAVRKFSGMHTRSITAIGRLVDETFVTSSQDGTILFSRIQDDSWTELLRLSFQKASIDWMRLSDDGRSLAFRCRNEHSIRFLRIDLVRDRLKQMNLDW